MAKPRITVTIPQPWNAYTFRSPNMLLMIFDNGADRREAQTAICTARAEAADSVSLFHWLGAGAELGR